MFTQLQGRSVFADAGSVQNLFYSEIEQGNIHNNKIKTSKGNIVAFQMGDLFIEENPHIESVLHIIDKLNRGGQVNIDIWGKVYIPWHTNILLNDLIEILFLIAALRFTIF